MIFESRKMSSLAFKEDDFQIKISHVSEYFGEM
jgi:hypothetical protein